MKRVKVLAGAVMGGMISVGAMGCQQAPPPAPTVVVEHTNDGHDGDRDRQAQAQRDQAQRDQAQRDQAQRIRIIGIRRRLRRGHRSSVWLEIGILERRLMWESESGEFITYET